MDISPKHQSMLDLVREHEEAERVGDLESTMATMAPYPVYDMIPFGLHFEGEAATREFYENFFAAGLTGFQNTCLGIWVNDDGVIREDFTNVIDITEFFGFTLPEPRTTRFHTVTIFPFEDGKIKGEKSYFDRGEALEPLGIKVSFEVQ
jgi:SnoaL-like domain